MKDISHIIHTTSEADLTQNVYTHVYAGVNASPTINGDVIDMIAGSSFEILVKSISSTPNVYVLGRKKMLTPLIINQ